MIISETFCIIFQGKGEKVPDVPVDIKRGIKDYRKTVSKQVIPVIEKVTQYNHVFITFFCLCKMLPGQEGFIGKV